MFMGTIISSQQDANYINDYIKGNESALEFLIKKHQTRLYNFIYSSASSEFHECINVSTS